MSKQNVIPLRPETLQSPVRGAYWRRWGLLWAIWLLGLGLAAGAFADGSRRLGDERSTLWLVAIGSRGRAIFYWPTPMCSRPVVPLAGGAAYLDQRSWVGQ
jgi:hypothetical protein